MNKLKSMLPVFILLGITSLVFSGGQVVEFVEEQGGFTTVPGARDINLAAMLPRYLVNYARSNTETLTETVVVVTNTGNAPVTVSVDWKFALAGVVGTSGPLILNSLEAQHFVTANLGESVEPFFVNAPRDTTSDFDGIAMVIADSAAIAVNAVLLVGNGQQPGLASNSYHDLNVIRYGFTFPVPAQKGD